MLRFILIAALFLTSCASTPQLTIATDAAFPPFHLTDDRGQVTGYDIELARDAARRAGYKPVVVVVPVYAELFSGLEEGRHDVIAATTGITAARRERFLFSEPYFRTCQAAVVRQGRGEPVRIADLKGRKVASSMGGTSEAAARAVGAGQIVAVSKERGGIDALKAHEVDAYVCDEFDAVAHVRAHPELAVIAQPAAMEDYGLVLRRNAHELKLQLDQALRQMSHEGTIDALRARFNLMRPADWPVKLN